jgi:phosphohistidine swiveling domain-containing protein
LAVSSGVAIGKARVVLRSDTTEQVRPGEILVAPFTDPGWTPYFLQASAIVMDMGGLLSHGSIIAREYGLPAVANVGPATRIIRTGQRSGRWEQRRSADSGRRISNARCYNQFRLSDFSIDYEARARAVFLEDTMRRYVFLGLANAMWAFFLTSFSSGARADDKKLDPAGVWELKMSVPGRPAMESILRLDHSGGKLVGVTEFRGRQAPIKDVELKGDQLSFRASFSQQGREFKFVYKGKLTADTFKGLLDADFGGRRIPLPFDGKRQKE